MKITYVCSGDIRQLILDPDSMQDSTHLDLCRGSDKPEVTIGANRNPRQLVIQFTDRKEKA